MKHSINQYKNDYNYKPKELKDTENEKKKQRDRGESDQIDKVESYKDEMSQFYEKLRQYMFQKHYSVKDMILQIKGSINYNIESLNDNEFYVEGKEKYHTRDQFSSIFLPILQEHHDLMLLEMEKLSIEIEKLSRKESQEAQELKDPKELRDQIETKINSIKSQYSDLSLITYDDVIKYWEAFVNSREKQKDKQKEKIDINKFYTKFLDYIECKKPIHDKQKLKKQQEIKENHIQKSQMIQSTYQIFLKQFQQVINYFDPLNFYRIDRIQVYKASDQLSIKLINADVDQIITNLTNQLLSEARVQQDYTVTLIMALFSKFSNHKDLPEQETLDLFQFNEKNTNLSEVSNSSNTPYETPEINIRKFYANKPLLSALLIYLNCGQEYELNQKDLHIAYKILQIFISMSILDGYTFQKNFYELLSQNEEKAFIFFSFISRAFQRIDHLLTTVGSIDSQLLRVISSILQITQQLCSNSSFQMFLRKQQLTQYVSVDILEEIIYFASKYELILSKSKQTDFLSLQEQCFKTLLSFCTGQIENQHLILNHQDLLRFIQSVIENQKYDLLSCNFVDSHYQRAFKACLQLLLTLQIGIKNSSNLLITMFQEISFQSLYHRVIQIFQNKIANRISIIIKGNVCTHQDNVNCSNSRCEMNYITKNERTLFKLCFDILIFFNVLKDLQNDLNFIEYLEQQQQKLIITQNDPVKTAKKSYWNTIRQFNSNSATNQENFFGKNVKFIKLYVKNNIISIIQIKLYQYVQIQEFSIDKLDRLFSFIKKNNDLNSYLDNIDIKQPIQTSFKKQFLNFSDGPSRFKQKFEEITKRYAVEKKKSSNIDELVPLKSKNDDSEPSGYLEVEQFVPGKRLAKLSQRVNDAALNWHEDISIKAQQEEKKKQWSLQLVSSVAFFGKFLAQIELKIDPKESKLQRIYFIFPFSSSFLSGSTIQTVIQDAEKHKEIGEQRFKRLLSMAAYFEEEVLFRQKISQYTALNYITLQLNLFKIIAFILALIINILYIADLALDNRNIQTFQHPQYEWINLILTIFQLIFAGIILIIQIFNKFPQVKYQMNEKKDHYLKIFLGEKKHFLQEEDKAMEPRKIMVDYFLSYIKNQDVIYDIIYFIASLISIQFMPFTSVLLFDIMRRNKEITNVLKSIVLNYKHIFLIASLTLIIIYGFSFLGFLVFWREYTEISTFKQRRFYYIFAYTVQLGFLKHSFDPFQMEQIRNLNSYWGTYFFSLCFYLFISLSFFTLIIGLISGTYSQRRVLSQKEEEDIYAKCRICGSTQIEYEEKNMDWQNHITYTHSLSSYLFFINTIQNKKYEECNEMERYIKNQIELGNMSWLPRQQ